jgi:hypothetical protein
MKKIIGLAFVALVLIAVGVFIFSDTEDLSESDHVVLQKTLDISTSYVVLRMKTDHLLMEAKNYPSYEEWQADMNATIIEWSEMEQEALALERLANEMIDKDMSFKMINSTFAYDRQEISRVFDRAPAGKKISTLAKHLGVDAKRAYAILTQDQAQVQADAWNEAGDTFKKLETSAVVIKDTSKVVTFVGTVVLSGGTSAIAAGSVMTKAAVVVAGADLTLEVTDDAAKIALGDKNKISTVVGSAREVTEPASAILMISTLPSNVTKAVDKLSVATFGADQLNSSVQEGKVIGISLPTAVRSSATKPNAMTVSVMENAEVGEWLNENGATETTKTVAEIKETLEKNIATANEAKATEDVAEKMQEGSDRRANGDTSSTSEQSREGENTRDNKSTKHVQMDFKNATGETWVIEKTSYGSQDYRGEMDAIYAKDFAVSGGASFISINKPADEMVGRTGFVETSPTTYEYKIQLVAGGVMPEDEDEQYVYDPFVAVVDFVVTGTYGTPVTVVWDGSTFRQEN